MSLSADEIKELLQYIESSGWDEAHITVGDSTISVSKNGAPAHAAPAAPAPSPSLAEDEPAPAPAPPAAAPDGHAVSSPSVGVFWRSPEPGAPPFVEVGDLVEPGQNLCIVEVMKLMNYVAADVRGVVLAIHVENGHSVEHGTVLFSIEPQHG